MSPKSLPQRACAIALSILSGIASAPALGAAPPLPRHKPRVTGDAADASTPASAPRGSKKSKKAKQVAPVEGSARADPGPLPTIPAPADNEQKPAKATSKVIDVAPGQADSPPSAAPRPSRATPAADDEISPGDEERPRRRGSSRRAPDEEVPAGFTEIPLSEETSESDEPTRERGFGLSAEFVAGILHLDGGAPSTTLFGWGISTDWQLGRLFARGSYLHENLFLELSWLHAGSSYGTLEVKVAQSQNHFAAAMLLGYTLASAFFYGKVGPSIFVMPVTYDVQASTTDYMGIEAGLQYGVGVRSSLYFSDALGVALRLELNGYRRGYLNDFFFCAGIGAAF